VLQKVVFLDRDGTINQDSPDYIKGWAEFDFIPRSIEAIRNFTRAGFTVIVVTNQSAIARKLISRQELELVHSKMKAAVASKGGKISDIFLCPHMPSDGCDCRKPSPGLIYQAQKKYDIDLSAAVMIGDSVRDIESAQTAGCGLCVLVRTGNGKATEQILADKRIAPDFIGEDLYDAARWMIDLHW
jgi:D-glycero-D-manno-heptose 1,7-bisphosphate phosphatase